MEEAEETGQAEAKAAASDETGKRRKSRKGSPQEDTDDILKNIYVRRDTRTFEEFSGEEREIGGRHPGFTAVPAEDYGETSARSHSGNLIRKPGISTIRSRWNASMKIVRVRSRTAAPKRITGKKIYPLTAVIRSRKRGSIMTASISRKSLRLL